MRRCKYHSSPLGHPIILNTSLPTVYILMPLESGGFLVFDDMGNTAHALY